MVYYHLPLIHRMLGRRSSLLVSAWATTSSTSPISFNGYEPQKKFKETSLLLCGMVLVLFRRLVNPVVERELGFVSRKNQTLSAAARAVWEGISAQVPRHVEG